MGVKHKSSLSLNTAARPELTKPWITPYQ